MLCVWQMNHLASASELHSNVLLKIHSYPLPQSLELPVQRMVESICGLWGFDGPFYVCYQGKSQRGVLCVHVHLIASAFQKKRTLFPRGVYLRFIWKGQNKQNNKPNFLTKILFGAILPHREPAYPYDYRDYGNGKICQKKKEIKVNYSFNFSQQMSRVIEAKQSTVKNGHTRLECRGRQQILSEASKADFTLLPNAAAAISWSWTYPNATQTHTHPHTRRAHTEGHNSTREKMIVTRPCSRGSRGAASL